MIKSDLIPFQLRFKHPFKIAHGIRSTTDVIYVRLQYENYTGWGEATLPPYLPETQQSVIDFLSLPEIMNISVPFNPFQISGSIDLLYEGNYAAKAALDIALWDLKSQIENTSIGKLLGIEQTVTPFCTYTLGVSSFEEMQLKVTEANNYGFELFKLKLNGENDLEIIENFRKLSPRPFAVDVNQGWKTITKARHILSALQAYQPVLIEQPLPIAADGEMPGLKDAFNIPFYADESCQLPEDVDKLPGRFSGVNIKLMKCGGLSPAVDMIRKAKSLGLSVLIGCMSESSVGCSAASHLTPLADFADLDGPYLIANNPFTGMTVQHGRIKINPLRQVDSLNF